MAGDLKPGIGIALLTPDLFITGVWPLLVERLDALGLHLAGFAVVDATDATMAALYAGNHAKPGRTRIASSLGRKLPALDMNVAVAFGSSAGIDVPALLDAAKGSSAYGARRPGDLREAGRITQRTMSLIHTPDPELAARDARILFGAAAGGLDPAARLYPSVIGDVRGYLSPADEPHPYEIVCRSIVRIATVLSLDARLGMNSCVENMSSVVKSCRDLIILLRNLAAEELPGAVSAGLDSIADLVNDLRSSPLPISESTALGTEAVGGHQMDLLRALAVLVDCSVWSERTGELVVSAMLRAALFLSPWEQHMILVALTFFPRNHR